MSLPPTQPVDDAARAMPPSAAGDAPLPEALAMVAPLVTWLIRSGVGHSAFAAALKPVFLAQAQAELAAQGQKPTDSALSLQAGLHRKDVRALRDSAKTTLAQVAVEGAAWSKPSAANQVLTRWLAMATAADSLPLAGEVGSFEALARAVSKDVHPRTVLHALLRLGLVRQEADRVLLVREAFVPDPSQKEARELFASAVADHLHAGVHNLSARTPAPHQPRKFLEQSVFADGLSPESVQQLHQLANSLWAQLRQAVVQAATPLCEQDAQHPTPQRFRLGLFSYSAADNPPSSLPAAPKGDAAPSPNETAP